MESKMWQLELGCQNPSYQLEDLNPRPLGLKMRIAFNSTIKSTTRFVSFTSLKNSLMAGLRLSTKEPQIRLSDSLQDSETNLNCFLLLSLWQKNE
jgi:hypothetical protein